MNGSPQTQACIKEKDQGLQEVCSRGKWAAEEGRAQTSSYTCNQVDTSAADGGPKDSADDTTQPKGEAQPASGVPCFQRWIARSNEELCGAAIARLEAPPTKVTAAIANLRDAS